MRTLCFTLLALFGLLLYSAAQPAGEWDSLERLVARAKEDSAKVDALNNLGYRLQWHDPQKAISYCLPSLSLAQRLPYKRGEMRALFIIGEALAVSGHYTKATELKFRLLKEAEDLGDETEIGGAYMAIASGFYYQGAYAETIKNTHKAIAVPHFYEKAALQLNGFLAESFFELHLLDSALYYAQKAYEMDVKKTDRHWVVPYYTLAGIHQAQKHYSLALEYYRLGLSVQPPYKDVADGNLGLAHVFYDMARLDSALHFARKTITQAGRYSFQAEVLEAAQLAAKIFKQQGRADSVLAYQDKVMEARDSLFSQEKVKAVQNLLFSEQLRQQEVEARKRVEEEAARRNLQYAAIALGTVTFFILFFVFSQSVLANPKLIRFLGVLSLLLVFEFINLFLHPQLAHLTHESPLWMLLIMVCIAAGLIPLHHRMEHWVIQRLVEKNNKLRLASARRTIRELEGTGEGPAPKKGDA